jgi:hypothetical protein
MSQVDSANRVPTGSISPAGALPTGPTGQPKVWKIRAIKNYAEAHNHVLVGKVLEVTDSYVRLHCRTFHFGPSLENVGDVLVGAVMVRVIPWSRIEIINELPADFDYVRSTVISDKPGQVLFKDKQYLCPIGRGSVPSY